MTRKSNDPVPVETRLQVVLALREAAELPVARFAALAGISERTYRRRLAALRGGDEPVKGPWPTPAVDAAEALAAKYASDWPAWGHRKIAAMMRADGHHVSTSTVERALRRRCLLLPRGFRADRKSWAALRRKVFHDPPTVRNRVWRICAVIDYATKYCLAATITPTGRGADAIACLHAAVAEAQRVLGLADLREDRGEIELVDETTGEILDVVAAPIAVVSDNGSCFRGETYQAAFAGDDPLLRHVRTRVRSPQTNGVIERFFGTLKYEHSGSAASRRWLIRPRPVALRGPLPGNGERLWLRAGRRNPLVARARRFTIIGRSQGVDRRGRCFSAPREGGRRASPMP
ncbi:MAG TPA: hypothetical protein VGH11_06965 [Jatrophihabitans sp.]